MNCKPGDLAIIVRTTHAEDHEFLGRIIRVINIEHHYWSDAWVYEVPTLVRSTGEPIMWISDDCLQPIRGEPNEETHETERVLETV